MFGKGKLNKAEQKHLREMHIRTKYDFQKQIDFLKKIKNERPKEPGYRCHECYYIAKKLGTW